MGAVFALIACGVIWGSQYVVNVFALAHFDPLWIAIVRAGVGFLLLWTICRIRGLRREPGGLIIIMLIGFLEVTLPLLLITWGQKTTPSAFAAIITGMIPLFTALFAMVILKGERWSLQKAVAIFTGFVALLYLYWPQIEYSQMTHFRGALAILAASMCFAASMVMVRTLKHRHPIVLARDMLMAGTLQLLIISSYVQPYWPVNIGLSSVLPLLYLGIFCGGVVYLLFIWLISHHGPIFASYSNYIVPVMGVLLSAMVWHTTFNYRVVVSLLLVFFSLWLCRWRIASD